MWASRRRRRAWVISASASTSSLLVARPLRKSSRRTRSDSSAETMPRSAASMAGAALTRVGVGGGDLDPEPVRERARCSTRLATRAFISAEAPMVVKVSFSVQRQADAQRPRCRSSICRREDALVGVGIGGVGEGVDAGGVAGVGHLLGFLERGDGLARSRGSRAGARGRSPGGPGASRRAGWPPRSSRRSRSRASGPAACRAGCGAAPRRRTRRRRPRPGPAAPPRPGRRSGARRPWRRGPRRRTSSRPRGGPWPARWPPARRRRRPWRAPS